MKVGLIAVSLCALFSTTLLADPGNGKGWGKGREKGETETNAPYSMPESPSTFELSAVALCLGVLVWQKRKRESSVVAQ